ncbi:MAG: ABC transporter permease, partial [Thermoguttaceae bacterium]|nr:ABC transporter permease [Thermoguttaceae bacterium]
VMGTPSGSGLQFWATDAQDSPFELIEGQWFASPESNAREAVLTEKGAEKLRAKPGDSIFLICPKLGTEFQLKVVGVVADPNFETFYVSTALGREIAGTEPLATSALMLKLRTSVDDFRGRWSEKIAARLPNFELVTEPEIIERKAAQFKQNQSFKYQAASGTLLAALASIFIVFTALNASVAAQRRLIAFYRAVGLTRGQVALSILLEALVLAIPGWLGGVATGWALVFVCSGKATGVNWETVGVSFGCAVVGAVLAALWPMLQSARTKPLEAIGGAERTLFSPALRRRQTRLFAAFALLGAALIGVDIYLVQFATGTTPERAALHSGVGVLALALGVVLLIPATIRGAEIVLLPVLAKLFRFDYRLIRSELSGNASRVVAVSVALSVGGGLFVSTQIWGYSMLEPFLPGRGTPNCFAAFLPNGLRSEQVAQLADLPCVKRDSLLEVAVEQAAFDESSIPPQSVRKSAFANVVFFGVDVEWAFLGCDGKSPLVGFRFLEGEPKNAFAA